MTKIDDMFNFHQSALRLRAQRQEIIASNIANADTPNYKAKDINFAKALNEAVAASSEVKGGSAAQLNSTKTSDPAPVQYRSAITQASVDGNSVDSEVERNSFIDNALRYEASVGMVNSDIKDMLAVLQNS
jgi:flagellar basal-body rod protein FlgB